MTNTPATFKQADLRRAIRAARKESHALRVRVTKAGQTPHLTTGAAHMSDLVDRLNWHHEHPVTGQSALINPDGPEAAVRIRELEAKVESMRKALEPFAMALNDSRLSYARRYNEPLEHGFSVFDKMPDKWPMRGVRFNMGELRRAAAAIGEKEAKRY